MCCGSGYIWLCFSYVCVWLYDCMIVWLYDVRCVMCCQLLFAFLYRFLNMERLQECRFAEVKMDWQSIGNRGTPLWQTALTSCHRRSWPSSACDTRLCLLVLQCCRDAVMWCCTTAPLHWPLQWKTNNELKVNANIEQWFDTKAELSAKLTEDRDGWQCLALNVGLVTDLLQLFCCVDR